ncbi:Epididymal sperm-binding protein 1, partial [Ophiophagus hannah]
MIQSPSCVFPFIFKEKVYSTCTNEGMSDGKFWCATTNNYDVDKKWVYCNDTGPDENVESLPCVFPFVFKNQVYTGCTTNGRSDGRYWCATSSNYNIDKMWRFCSEESGPDPNVEDPTCVFPFIYKDKLYTTCTADGMRNGRCWCATTSNYDVDKKWTYCNITDPDPKIDGPTCVFPFIYNGNSYSTCISNGMRDGKKWCATTGNYDVDKKWMCCNDTGPGTTEETHKCVFPFIYNGKSYNSCTRDGQEDGKLWCAITENYDVDKRLTFCTITKTGCVFPFIYKGKSYESCTTMDHNEGKTWCATTPDYKSGLKWRLCNAPSLPCVFPFLYEGKYYPSCTTDGSSKDISWCALTDNYDEKRLWKQCAVTEYGGNSGGKPCVFPFLYKSYVYYTCAGKSDRKGPFWCSTTGNYDKDKKWSYCADTRLDANYPTSPCIFPFIFENNLYSTCTIDGRSDGRLWCSISSNFDFEPMWAYCEPSEYGGNSNGQPCVFPFNYKGEEVTTCIDEDEKNEKNGRFWCAATENFDVDMKWSFCADTRLNKKKDTESKEPCFFPFAYKKKVYSACTTDGTSGWKLWCSLTANYNTDHKWRYCEPSAWVIFIHLLLFFKLKILITIDISIPKFWLAGCLLYEDHYKKIPFVHLIYRRIPVRMKTGIPQEPDAQEPDAQELSKMKKETYNPCPKLQPLQWPCEQMLSAWQSTCPYN